MNKFIALIIFTIIISLLSCEKEIFPIRKTIIIQNYKYELSINGVTKEKYILDTNRNLKSATIYDNNNQITNHETYEYYNDNRIKYSLKYYGNSTSIFDTIYYTYTAEKITGIHEPHTNYTIIYKNNGEIDKINITTDEYSGEHKYNYNTSNVITKSFSVPSVTMADTMLYDKYKNPYKDFWPFDFSNPRYISANNITNYKSIIVEDTNWGTGQAPSYTIDTISKLYFYTYTTDSFPHITVEYDLVEGDTTIYLLQYFVIR